MESFEQFVALAMEAEGLVVSEAIKFPVTQQTRKAAYAEVQTHGFEVDLVGARSDRLVLATVKSFFGSRGVVADQVMGTSADARGNRLYALLNNLAVRDAVIAGAAKRYGYSTGQITIRLYGGRFASPKSGSHETRIRDWAGQQMAGAGAIEVYGLKDVVGAVRAAAASLTYRDNPVIVTMKVLMEAGLMDHPVP